METAATATLSSHQLNQIITSVDAAVVLAPNHIIRRVIRLHTSAAGFLRKTQHRKSLVISSQELSNYVDPDELDLPSSHVFSPRVLLIQRPRPEKLNTLAPSQILREYSRLLFHSKIDAHMAGLVESGHLTPAVAIERIHAIGQSAFDEIRSVLGKEKYLLPPADNVRVYSEFVAVYLELKHYLPYALEVYFPALDSFERVDQLLAADIDAQSLYEASRLPGAAAPGPVSKQADDSIALPAPAAKSPSAEDAREIAANYERMIHKADKAASLGNYARSAITRNRAVHLRYADDPKHARNVIRPDIEKLAHRVCKVLDIEEGDALVNALAGLLDPKAIGWNTPGARLLYDLQAVCIDHEKDIFKLDLIAWILSRGEVPIKRTLPSAKEVRLHQHLSKAVDRLHKAPFPELVRTTLLGLLEPKLHDVEHRVRETLRPKIEQAVHESGLVPANPPEEIARHKLIEELLDRIVERGFITFGDLRDAISRNDLKLPELTQAAFIKGDELLKIDKRLAKLLDGVYRRGEIYRRWPQRMSSLAFGTRVGRFLTQYLAMPFLGAFLLLESVQHIAHMFVQAPPRIAGNAVAIPVANVPMPVRVDDPVGLHLNTPLSIFITGLILLWLFHADRIRAALFNAIRWGFNRFYGMVIELPSEILRLQWVKRIVNNRAARLTYRYVLKPAAFGALAWFICEVWGLPWGFSLSYALGFFIIMNLLFNTRAGRGLEEAGGDLIVRIWRRFAWRALVGVFYWIVDVFKWFLDAFEELRYNVDEWLRFRTGENRAAFIGKLIFGTLWFFVSYIVIFSITLLIEPQINPIKHFPVVTVSHKVMLGMIPVFADWLTPLFNGNLTEATIFVGSVVWLIPGIFGYLAWELKENWRLYQANRSAKLKPFIIGHHGESMLGLLRPGFHSGTVPKLYGKLRKLERRRDWNPPGKAERKHLLALHHVEEAVHRFVERDLIATLAQSKAWGDVDVAVGHVHLGGNNISIELHARSLASDPAVILFEEQSGWLLVSIRETAWMNQLNAQQQSVLKAALSGFYKHAAVDLVREQVENVIDVSRKPYDVEERGIVVWPTGAAEPVTIYPLHREVNVLNGDGQTKSNGESDGQGMLKPGEAPKLLRHQVLSWDCWVKTWSEDRQGAALPDQLVDGPSLLPHPSRNA